MVVLSRSPPKETTGEEAVRDHSLQSKEHQRVILPKRPTRVDSFRDRTSKGLSCHPEKNKKRGGHRKTPMTSEEPPSAEKRPLREMINQEEVVLRRTMPAVSVDSDLTRVHPEALAKEEDEVAPEAVEVSSETLPRSDSGPIMI